MSSEIHAAYKDGKHESTRPNVGTAVAAVTKHAMGLFSCSRSFYPATANTFNVLILLQKYFQKPDSAKLHTMDSGDPFNLARFIAPQEKDYQKALSEMRRGAKTSHWIWYIFPQLEGLSTSHMGKRYAVSGLEEAQSYLKHPTLKTRLVEITQVVLDSPIRSITALMGSGIDVTKMHASMTLFLRADPGKEVFDFQAVLDKYYKGATHAQSDQILKEKSSRQT